MEATPLQSLAIGFAAGVITVGVVVYITAPAIAGKVTRDAVNRQGSRLLGLPSGITAPLANQLARIVRAEVETQLKP